MRTHNCNELRKEHIGQTATIIGWVNTKRDHHGVIFIDVRDREGLTQAVFRSEEDAEAAKHSHSLRQEDIVSVTGTVSERPEIPEKTVSKICLLYTSPSPRDRTRSRMPSSA